MNLGFSRRNVVHHAPQKSRRPPKRRRLLFDHLEERRLLTAGTLSTSPDETFAVASYPPGNTAPGNTLDPPAVASTSSRAVAMDNKGDTVVVWDDSPTDPTTNQPTGQWTNHFQLYTEGTNATTGATQLNAGTGGPLTDLQGNQVAPTDLGSPWVAMAPTSGEFVVVWESRSLSSAGYYAYSTYAQVYSDVGTPLTNPIQVGSAGNALPFGVAMSDNGFDLLYGVRPSRIITDSQDLTVQRYSATGAPVGKPIAVVQATLDGYSAAISADPAGNVVVGWSDVVLGKHGSPTYDTLNWQRYTSGGNASGGAVHEDTQSNLAGGLDVAMDSSDAFALTWVWGGGTAGPIQAQAVDSNNNLLGPQINPGGGSPSVSMEPNGDGYALSWADGATVYAATYSLNGTAETAPFAVYTAPAFEYVSNGQTYAASPAQSASAAIDGAGNVLVVYSGYWSDSKSMVYTDGGVFVQFYLDPPAPATSTSTSSPTTSSPAAGVASPSGSTTAVTDAVFAAYAYPEDDDTLG